MIFKIVGSIIILKSKLCNIKFLLNNASIVEMLNPMYFMEINISNCNQNHTITIFSNINKILTIIILILNQNSQNNLNNHKEIINIHHFSNIIHNLNYHLNKNKYIKPSIPQELNKTQVIS